MRFPLTLALTLALAPVAAMAQVCDSETLSDGVCDCGCNVVDPACPVGGDSSACRSNRCGAGLAPMKAFPSTCAASVCGDGWRDQRVDEACDDGDTLPTGGCSATCEAVTPGYVCGTMGAGCTGNPDPEVDAGQPDAGVVDAGQPGPTDAGTGGGTGGGSGGGGGSMGGGAGGGGGAAGNTKPPPSSEPPSTGCTATGPALLGLAGLLALARRRAR